MSDEGIDPRFRELIRTGDSTLRNEIVGDNRGLAYAFARRYRERGVAAEDLDQIALEGLVLAVDGFDPERGVRFSTYAARRIEGALKQYFRDRTWPVHVPRSAKQRASAVQSALVELTQRLGRSPRPADIAEHLGIEVDEVVLAMETSSAYRTASIEATEVAAAESSEAIDRFDARMTAPRLLDHLAADDRMVVELRFYENLTQSEIAARVGVSQMQVSRVLRQSIERLREIADVG